MPIVSLLGLNPNTNLSASLDRTSMKKFLSNRIPHSGKKSASSLSPTTATNDSDKDKASVYSALSSDSNKKKRILDAFWDDSTPDETGNSKNLAKRYKKVIHSIDSLERKVWENLSGSMKGSEESEISILGNFIRTSKAPYNQEIRQLSHKIIYRLIISGIASLHTSDTEFVKTHLDFLATKYPASLLLALTVTSAGTGETQNFIDFVTNTWSKIPLGQTCLECSHLLRSYSTVPGVKLADNIEAYATVLLANLERAEPEVNSNLLATQSEEENPHANSHSVEWDDLSLFVGLFPWMYFKLQPVVDNNTWSAHALLTTDTPFSNRITKNIFTSLTSRRAILSNLASYHSTDEENTTVLHVLMYVWAGEMFPLQTEGENEKGKGREVVHEVPESIKTDLVKRFKPGRWMAQAFYTSTRGPLLLSSFRSFYPSPSQSHPTDNDNAMLTLVRFVALNLGRWEQIKRGSAGEYGMVRVLYLGAATLRERAVVVARDDDGVHEAGDNEKMGLTVEEWREGVWALCALLQDPPPPSPHSGNVEENQGFLSRALSRNRSGSKSVSKSSSSHPPSSNKNNSGGNGGGTAKKTHKQTPSIVITSPPSPASPTSALSPTFLSPTSASSPSAPTPAPTAHPLKEQISITTALETLPSPTCSYETLCSLIPPTAPKNSTQRAEIQNEMCVGLLRVALLGGRLGQARVLRGVVEGSCEGEKAGSDRVREVLEGIKKERGELWEE